MTAGINEAELRKLFPYQSRYFQVGTHRLHYIDEGRGPLVLLMHSCPFWMFEYRTLIADLIQDHRVIALDQLGFGLSDKPSPFDYRIETHADHLERFIHELGLTGYTLIQHGRGAAVGMAVAVRHPDTVKGFVTLNAMSFSDYTLPLRLQLCRIKFIGAKILMYLNVFNRDVNRLPAAVQAAYNYPFRNGEDQYSVLRFIEDIPCAPEEASAQTMFEIESALWQLRDKPSCIIWAKKDWLYNMKNQKKWLQYFPRSDSYTIDHAGRCITEDAPEEVNRYIRDFLVKNAL